ncbi:MAG: ATP-binding protein [Candidatus Krumholzibacteriia bacterium]
MHCQSIRTALFAAGAAALAGLAGLAGLASIADLPVVLAAEALADTAAPAPPSSGRRVLLLDQERLAATAERPLLVNAGWRYRPGDDSRWSDPELDDGGWTVLERTDMLGGKPPRGGFPGAGWFRLHLDVAPEAVLQDLAFDLDFHGAAEVFLNGRLLREYGEIGPTPAETRAWVDLGLSPHPLQFTRPGRHVIAVRFHNPDFGGYNAPSDRAGFEFYLGRFDRFLQRALQQHRWVAAVDMLGMGTLLLMSLLHLLLYALSPRERGNLWFSLSLLAVAGIVLISHSNLGVRPAEEVARLRVVFLYLVLTVAVLFPLFYYATQRPPWRWPLRVIVGACVVMALVPGWPTVGMAYAAMGASLLLSGVVIAWAMARRRRGARILAGGLVVCIAAVGYQLLADMRVIERRTPEVIQFREYLLGMMGLLVSMSLYIAFRMRTINRELERRIVEVQKLGEERMQALTRLTAGFAHEVNNPVGAIHSGADTVRRCALLLRQAVPPLPPSGDDVRIRRAQRALLSLDEVAGSITSGADRISALVKRMRSFTHLDQAPTQRVDLDGELDAALDMLAAEPGPAYHVERRSGDLPPVLCSPARLNQVFLNLLHNAREALPAEGGTITVSTRAAAGRVLVEIADNGAGIPRHLLKRVFEPGFTTKGSGVGTGLGLAIARRLVQEQGGRLRLESEPGRGTTAVVSLPAEAG